jgi:hypothetical protein
MKKNQSEDDRPLHQTVAKGFEFKSGEKSIAVEFTEQRLSAHAGSATFWAWLHGKSWSATLAEQLPHTLCSNNHLPAVAKALAFTHGLLCEARKLTHVAYFRRDPVVPELLGIPRVASQSSLSRFFAGFTSAGVNLRCFRPLWRWGIEQLPSRRHGYTLDLDSTRLLHEDGQQEGVEVGYTRLGLKPCLHPLLAVLAEARLVVQLWLRSGNAACGNNVAAFFLDLWDQRPRHIRFRAVRAEHAAALCMIELGLRNCEVVHLRLEDIDWNAGLVRVIPLGEHFFVCRRGAPFTPQKIGEHFNCVVRGIEPNGARPAVRFGDLRHTFASRLISAWSRRTKPVPHYLALLSRYMGHKSFNATWWYVSPDCSSLQGAAQLFQRFQCGQTSNDS